GMLEFKQRVDVSGDEHEHAPADPVVGAVDPLGIAGLAWVTFDVNDLDRATDFWTSLLGAVPGEATGEERPDRRVLRLPLVGTDTLDVVLIERPSRPTNRLVEVAFAVDDVRVVRRHLEGQGFP